MSREVYTLMMNCNAYNNVLRDVWLCRQVVVRVTCTKLMIRRIDSLPVSMRSELFLPNDSNILLFLGSSFLFFLVLLHRISIQEFY